MTITLIGYRGSGKSSVAPLLAQQLNLEWVDSDRRIEEVTGLSIREIFAHQGEAGFRCCERTVIAELAQQSSLIIAAGGGAILAPENRACLRNAGPVIWLQASIATLTDRISGDAGTPENRPALTNRNSLEEEITEVLSARTPLYRECATLQVDTDALSPQEIVDRILSGLGQSIAGRVS